LAIRGGNHDSPDRTTSSSVYFARESHFAAMMICAAMLSVAAVTSAFGATATGDAAVTAWSSHVAGPCTDRARYILRVERADNQLLRDLQVHAKPGSRWSYSLVMRNGTASTEDSAELTAGPDGWWGASFQWLKNHVRPVTTVNVRGVSRAGQVCRATFSLQH